MRSTPPPSICLHPLDCDAILNDAKLTGVLENGMPICSAGVRDFLHPVAQQTAAHFQRKPREAPWISYLVADAGSGQIVGVCAFTDAPNGGEVEIAYYTFPSYEGMGYATAAVASKVAIAMKSPLVQKVVAHTLREPNASTRVLTRCGFVQTQDAIDPDEGVVWRWEMRADGTPCASESRRTQTERL